MPVRAFLRTLIYGPEKMLTGLDLQAIAAAAPQSSEGYEERIALASRIEGMFSAFSMAALDMALGFQALHGIKGDILEIGTFRGKCAALLAQHLRAGERLTLVDLTDYLDRAALEPLRDRIEFILSPSARLKSAMPRYGARRGTFRFIHIDAGHGYRETRYELALAEQLLGGGGIIAMDDFANLNFAQNMAAIFNYLFTGNTGLRIFLLTDEKAYLCRKGDLDFYLKRVLEQAVPEMRGRGIDAVIARTSSSRKFHPFYLRSRLATDRTAFYGEDIYRAEILAGW